VVIFVEGARRPGYNPTYHTASELELGPGGWIQRGSFLLMAAGMFAYSIGVYQLLDTLLGAILLDAFGLGSLVSGVFAPDPVRGYPPGAPSQAPSEGPSWQAKVHHSAGPLMFLALFGACLTVAGRVSSPWRVYSVVTAIVGLGMMVWTALAYRRNAANTGLVQRGLLAVYLLWIAALGIHLATT
jgi:hypothetical protein